MKKVFAILLVLALVAGFVFAADGAVDTDTKKLTVTSTVEVVYPQFNLTGVYSSTTYTATETTTALGGTNIPALSIADNTIVVECTIAQLGGVKKTDAVAVPGYSRYKGTVTFGITVGDLTEQEPGTGNTAATVAGHIVDTAIVSATSTTGHDGTGSGTTAATTGTVINAITNTKVSDSSIKSVYNGKVLDQNIATFKAVWYQDDRVPNGDYKADITVTISAT